MLIYEYKCKKCTKEYLFRTYAPYNGEALRCPNCGSEDNLIFEYKPSPEDYPGWDSCSTGSFG
jgi:DNA-directed RNA polymerase subunit RPC12/RpoP